MINAPIPKNEDERLKALLQYKILDSSPEEEFDNLTRLASYICGTSIALVSLVDANRVWFKSRVGLEALEAPRDQAFCSHAIVQPDVFIIPDAQKDDRFSDNPLVTSAPNLRFYAGTQLVTHDGQTIGTLCAIDYVPRNLTPEQVEALRILGRQVMAQLELRRNYTDLVYLTDERQRTAAALLQAEAKYRSIFENATQGIFQIAPEGRFLSANPALASIYGYSSPEELIAKISDVENQIYVNPETYHQAIATLEKNNFVSEFESQVYRRDGSIIWIWEKVRAVRDSNSKLLYYEGTVDDITARKRAETALQASQIKLGMQQVALIELARCQYLYNGELSLALKEITETAAYTLGMDRVSIWLYNQDRSQMCCVDLYELNANCHSEGLELYAVEYPTYFKALENTESALAIDNLHNDPRTQEFSRSSFSQLGITSMLDAPIRLGGKTVGMLCVRHIGTPLKWSLEEQNFVSYLAYMASLAMESSDRQRAQEALRQEQEKVELLLLNILPEPIAQRLKKDTGPIAENFKEVTVLFADIVGFTEIAGKIPPTQLVAWLNQIFSAFDQLAEQNGLEKIKTIGDAYMVVGGLPTPRSDHAEAIAQMALDMQNKINRFKTKNGIRFQIRVGIHTGPVVAGVIGIKKFIYDLWGDTVNIASRMESHGIPGQIQVTDTIYERLQEKFIFQERGMIPIKGKGKMTTYLLTGKKELLTN